MELQTLLGLEPIIRKSLPSSREINGSRFVPFNPEQLQFANLNKESKELCPAEVSGLMAQQRANAYDRIPENEQLNLFATSENPQAFTDLLNSDAVKGMDANELNALEDQFVATHPQAIPQAVDAIPGIMNTANKTGMFPKLLGTAGAVSALAKLYANLSTPALSATTMALPMM